MSAPDLDHLHPTVMRPRVDAFLADPRVREIGVYVVSAYRPPEYQAKLYQAAIKKYGSPKAAGKWVAPPWRSNHGPVLDEDGHRVPYGEGKGGKWGGAVDLGIPGHAAVKGQWPADLELKVHGLAALHGLFFPMAWEDWHAEPIANWKPPASSTPIAPPQEAFDMGMAISPSWGTIKKNGLTEFFHLVEAGDKAFNVISYNDAKLDRVDGIAPNKMWFLHQDKTTGEPVAIIEKSGVILVLCAGGGVYKVADAKSKGQPK